MSDWLNGVSDALVNDVEPASGLTLTVEAGGTFAERLTGDLETPWFDEEGVLVNAFEPFDGVVI
jgi:hypothetical protein